MSLPEEFTNEPETLPVPVIALESGETEPTPVLAIPVPTTPRFCRSCGAAWQPDWLVCGPCAVKANRNQTTPLTIATEWRAMKSSLWLYFTLLLICAIAIGLGRATDRVEAEFWISGAISLATIIWCFASPQSVLAPLRKVPNVVWFALATGMSLVTYAIAMGAIKGFDALLHVPDASMSQPILKAGYGWWVVILLTCVQPAVIEELAFRGVIFAGLTKALSNIETVIVSALMFMTLHLAPARFPHTLALGLGTGYLRLRTKSIYPGIAMHFSHNLLCVAGEWTAMH